MAAGRKHAPNPPPSSIPALDPELESELSALLQPSLPGSEVKIHFADRWQRYQITISWDGFRELLPEERFRLVMQPIPKEMYQTRLAQCVWFELATGETESDLMAMPRSEDIVSRDGEIAERLERIAFFDKLAEQLGTDPAKSCAGGLRMSREVLRALGQNETEVREACLLMIRYHVFCDCQVLAQARHEVETHSAPMKRAAPAGTRRRKRAKSARG